MTAGSGAPRGGGTDPSRRGHGAGALRSGLGGAAAARGARRSRSRRGRRAEPCATSAWRRRRRSSPRPRISSRSAHGAAAGFCRARRGAASLRVRRRVARRCQSRRGRRRPRVRSAKSVGPRRSRRSSRRFDSPRLTRRSEQRSSGWPRRLPTEVRALFGDAASKREGAVRMCRIIGACRLPGDVSLLLGLLPALGGGLRAAAVEALAGFAALGSPGSCPKSSALDVAMADAAADVRAAVVRGFDELSSESVVSHLARGLSDGDAAVRAAAVRALALRGYARGGGDAPRSRARRDRSPGASDARCCASGSRSRMIKTGAEPRMTNEEFRLVRAIIREYCGIDFPDDSKFLVERRLPPRLEALRLAPSPITTGTSASARARAELDETVERVTINETYFFREALPAPRLPGRDPPAIRDSARRRASASRCGARAARPARRSTPSRSLIRETRPLPRLGRARLRQRHLAPRASPRAPRRVRAARRSAPPTSPSSASASSSSAPTASTRSPRSCAPMCQFGHVNLLDGRDRGGRARRRHLLPQRAHLLRRRRRAGASSTSSTELLPGGYLLLGHSESLLNVSTAFELVHLSATSSTESHEPPMMILRDERP